jgi:hypothetical protein
MRSRSLAGSIGSDTRSAIADVPFLGERLDGAGPGAPNRRDRRVGRRTELDEKTCRDRSGTAETGAALEQHATAVAQDTPASAPASIQSRSKVMSGTPASRIGSCRQGNPDRAIAPAYPGTPSNPNSCGSTKLMTSDGPQA